MHISVSSKQTMEDGESIKKAEVVDRYASMSFKNATGGKIVLLCYVNSPPPPPHTPMATYQDGRIWRKTLNAFLKRLNPHDWKT